MFVRMCACACVCVCVRACVCAFIFDIVVIRFLYSSNHDLRSGLNLEAALACNATPGPWPFIQCKV